MSRRDQSGQIGGVEALAFGILIFVLGTLAIANAWGVIDAKMAAAGAAREAARTFVEAPDAQQAYALADEAAVEAIVAQGRNPARMHLTIAGAFARCSRIVATVTYRVPVVSVPLVGGFGSGFTVGARHSELVDPYRGGIPGTAQC